MSVPVPTSAELDQINLSIETGGPQDAEVVNLYKKFGFEFTGRGINDGHIIDGNKAIPESEMVLRAKT